MDLQINTSELRALSRDLGRVSPDLKTEVERGLKGAGLAVAVEARLISGFWSSRIPGSIRVATRGANTLIRAGGASARHAKYYEGPQSFSHPVFGHRDRWVKQSARPFLAPAVVAEGPAFERAAIAGIEAAFLRHGFH